MDNAYYVDSCGKKYSVNLSFCRNPFITYPVAHFDDLTIAYKWLKDLHNLLLRDHLLQIIDSDGDVVFNLSHIYEFDDDMIFGHYDTSEHWFSVSDDYIQFVLPF